jgi:hypothetical protein
MRTPTHVVINLVVLRKWDREVANGPIVWGAILPDVPMFLLYLTAKLFYRQPSRQIWSETYYDPLWQGVIDGLHSFPLILIGLIAAYSRKLHNAALFFASMFLHSLLDLPVHREDAHRHIFPFSNDRFVSPISFWDPKHYGSIVSLAEVLLVLGLSFPAFRLARSALGKGLIVTTNVLYLSGYVYFYAS